ncbi:ABC transporter substrate-binding protein [Pseudorhodoplanes sp.]|uniref:ABC transporter substrate-binding protein n=1 Tax=Pseudorhodoplanes sp. TaxID=1934341 RepID=UPI003D14FC6A
MKSYKKSLYVTATLAVSSIALGSTPAQANLVKLVYGIPASVTLSQAPIVAAKQLGYFKEEGLEVQIMGFKGSGTLIPQMLAKRVDIGYPNPDIIILSHAPGKEKLPLKFFYNVTRRSSWEFAVLADSPFKTVADLAGKKVGVGGSNWGNIPITKAEFKDLKIDATLVPVGVGAGAFLMLNEKRIDALNLFDAQHATLEALGTKIRRLERLPRYDALFTNGFVAHEDFIRDKPQAIIGFGRAVAKASVFCEANREACVKMFWKEYPDDKPSGDEAKVLADGVRIFSARFDKMLFFPEGQPRKWGAYDPQVWRDFVVALYEGGQLTTKDIDVDACYTNAFVGDFAKFDPEKIKAQAKSFK